MSSTQPARPAWMSRFWLVVLVLQLGLVVWALVEFSRGTPYSYPNQHLRSALISTSGLSIALGSHVAARRWLPVNAAICPASRHSRTL